MAQKEINVCVWRRSAVRVIFTLLTVLVLVFIFGNSATTGDDSSQLSLIVTEWLNGLLKAFGLRFELTHTVVRKLAHFTEYSVLGILLTATTWSWLSERSRRFWRVWLPLLGGLLTATLDELLQTRVNGRYGCVADVILDFAGVLWAALTASALLVLIETKKKR